MPITKETIIIETKVMNDGQLHIIEADIYDDGTSKSEPVNRRRRIIEVGDDVTAEDQLIKDVVKGVHTVARVNARAEAKSANSPQAVVQEVAQGNGQSGRPAP